MSIMWSEKEITLLESVRSTLSTREVEQLFTILGYQRSTESIRKKAKKLAIKFKDFGVPATHGLTQSEKDGIDLVLAKRDVRTTVVEPELPLTPAQKGEKTKAQRVFQIDMLEELQEIRRSVPRIGSVSTKKS